MDTREFLACSVVRTSLGVWTLALPQPFRTLLALVSFFLNTFELVQNQDKAMRTFAENSSVSDDEITEPSRTDLRQIKPEKSLSHWPAKLETSSITDGITKDGLQQ